VSLKLSGFRVSPFNLKLKLHNNNFFWYNGVGDRVAPERRQILPPSPTVRQDIKHKGMVFP